MIFRSLIILIHLKSNQNGVSIHKTYYLIFNPTNHILFLFGPFQRLIKFNLKFAPFGNAPIYRLFSKVRGPFFICDPLTLSIEHDIDKKSATRCCQKKIDKKIAEDSVERLS